MLLVSYITESGIDPFIYLNIVFLILYIERTRLQSHTKAIKETCQELTCL